mgnify:CR=1 FL=1
MDHKKKDAMIAIVTKRRDTNKTTTRHFPGVDAVELDVAALQMNTTVGALVEDIVAVWIATRRCARAQHVGSPVRAVDLDGIEGRQDP